MSLTSYRAAPPRVHRGMASWLYWPPDAPRIAAPGLAAGAGGQVWSGEEGGGPGGDLLCRGLSRSTIGAEGFHGRVRDGIGCLAPRYGHQAGQGPICEASWGEGDVRGEVSGKAARQRGFADSVLALGAGGSVGQSSRSSD